MRRTLLLPACALALAILPAAAARAGVLPTLPAIPAFGTAPTVAGSGSVDQTIGWAFEPTAPFTFHAPGPQVLTITALGFWDDPSTPGFNPVTVQLWTATGGIELASASVDSASERVGDFLYAPITPVVVPFRTFGYDLIANNDFNPYTLSNRTGVTPNGQTNYLRFSGGLVGVGEPSGGAPAIGPGFLFTPAFAIPEPSTLALAGIGAAALAAAAARRRRAAH